MWNHEEIVSGNKLRSDLSAPVWGIGQLIFGFEDFKTNSSDTLNTMVRVQVPKWINERLAIEYQVSGINVDFTNKPNSGSLWRKFDHGKHWRSRQQAHYFTVLVFIMKLTKFESRKTYMDLRFSRLIKMTSQSHANDSQTTFSQKFIVFSWKSHFMSPVHCCWNSLLTWRSEKSFELHSLTCLSAFPEFPRKMIHNHRVHPKLPWPDT